MVEEKYWHKHPKGSTIAPPADAHGQRGDETIMEITNLLEFSHRAQLREWFEQHAASDKECWIAMYRVRRPAECGDCLPYIDVVEEALCFGWIDSTLKRLPDGRLAQRLSPRRKRSHWTELNKQRCAELEQQGLMTEAGRKALAMAK